MDLPMKAPEGDTITTKEIADLLGIPRGTVRSRARRAGIRPVSVDWPTKEVRWAMADLPRFRARAYRRAGKGAENVG